MSIGGMQDVDVTPFQWPSRWSEWGRRDSPLTVVMGVPVVATF